MSTQHTTHNATLKRPFGMIAPESVNRSTMGSLVVGAVMSFPRNAEIYGEGEIADNIYKVIRGGVRSYKMLTDGRRQIGAFYFPDDTFGLEVGNEHIFSAEALVGSRIMVIKRSTIEVLAERDNAVARQLWSLTSRELRRVQNHMMLLIKTALERVASFLLEMSERVPAGNAVDLPMSRQDIADYLGLTIETVSRTLTYLEGVAAIEVPTSRHIVLRNRAALSRLNA
jgi:CRP-like cAMP-binding protein